MVKQNHKNTHETAEALEEIKFPSPGLNKVGPVGPKLARHKVKFGSPDVRQKTPHNLCKT